MKKLYISIFIFALSFIMYSSGVFASDSIYYYQTFDTVDTPQQCDMISQHSGTIVSIAQKPGVIEKNNCLLISRNTTNWAKGQSSHTFAQPLTDSFTLQFSFYLQSYAATYLADLYGSCGEDTMRCCYLRTTSSGEIMIFDNTSSSGSAVEGASYTAGAWNNVVMSVNLTQGTTTYYLNGSLIGTYCNGTNPDNIQRLEFGFYEFAPQNLQLYVDEVYVYNFGDYAPTSISAEFNDDNTLELMTDDASIYYTTDGSMPSLASTLYEIPIEINSNNLYVRAIAVNDVGIGPVMVFGPYNIQTFNGLAVVEKSLRLDGNKAIATATVMNDKTGVGNSVDIYIVKTQHGEFLDIYKQTVSVPNDENIVSCEVPFDYTLAGQKIYMMIWSNEISGNSYPICRQEMLDYIGE